MLCQNKDGLSLKRNDMGWKNSKQEKGCKKKVQSELRKFGIKQNYIGCNN